MKKREIPMRTQTLRKLTLICVVALSVLFSASSVVAQEESCDIDGVKVGFQGTVCGIGAFFVELNGVRANGVNTKCLLVVGGDFTFTSTNKAFARLKPNQTYVVTSGTGICVNHINFDVPRGYKLFIDGFETTTISKTTGGASFTGDGSWNVVLRKDCDCADEEQGKAGPDVNSVIWQAGLGKLTDGRSAESISIREKTLSASTYTPSVLIYTKPPRTTEVDVVKNGSLLRQIKTPQTLADIVVINSSEYDIRYYRPADVGAKVSGLYTLTGQPYVTWKFKNPEPATFTKLQILKIENGVTTGKSEYVWDPFIDTWTLSTGWSPATGNYSRVETVLVSFPNSTSRTETFIVKDGTGTVVSVSAKTYQTFPWGEELVQEVQDPDDAALTTTYSYYENTHFSEEHRYQKLRSVTFPDGSWEKYDYDIWFNISTIMRPWKDLSMATATEANSHVTLFGYTNSDNGVFATAVFPKIDFDQEIKIAGVTVSKRRQIRSIEAFEPEPLIAMTDGFYQSSDEGVAVGLIHQTVTTTYHLSATPFLSGRVASVVHPDGRRDSYSYEKGNYVPNADPALSQFTPDVNGLSERQTIVHGTTALPDGVAFKTTKETSVYDQFGHEVLKEGYVYNGTTYERVEWTVNTFDDRSHLTMSRDHKGQMSTVVWTGDKKTSQIDAGGVETVYTYDELDRIKTQTKKGIGAAGGFPAQSDVVTTFTYTRWVSG